MRILVLSGGNSSEREVSLRSAKSVIAALTGLGHEVVEYDTANGLDGIKDHTAGMDAVFPILHGKEGEDGTVQAKLEELGVKYLGADSRVSRLCFDKMAFKKAISELGVLTPKAELVTRQSVKGSELLNRPYVLKPNDGGSSVDTFMVRTPAEKTLDYDDIFERNPTMLLEELIEGTEITVPVLGDKALPVIEIVPPEGEEFDYDNKYNGSTQELCPPVSVSEPLQRRAQEIAETIHSSLGVRHLSRTDIIINDRGEMYVLELNTIPGLTDASLFPKAAGVAGLNMKDLVGRLLEEVLRKNSPRGEFAGS
jgi:D-alanine-D-alanine ligase